MLHSPTCTTNQVVVSERMNPARAGLPRALALPDPSQFQTTPSENIMNTKLYVLLAAGVLALAACKNETATAQGEAAEAAAATEAAGDQAEAAAEAAGTAAAEGVDAARSEERRVGKRRTPAW